MSTTKVPRGGETVLVVEDDPAVRSFAVKCLETLGYRVIAAADGRDALQRLAAGPRPDLLFTDVVMPGGLSGWELAQQARELHPKLGVLLTSGYPLETLIASGRVPAAGMQILPKPYRKAELVRGLRDALLAARAAKETTA